MLNTRKLLITTVLCTLIVACGNSGNTDNTVSPGQASYTVTFQSSWSSTTHPDNFPVSPHYSGLIGASHNVNKSYWDAGSLASSGIETMAETGSKTNLINEINNNISIGDSERVISGNGIGPSPGQVTLNFVVSPEYSFVTLVSMIAPSPDWFVGVSALNLMENGVWIENKTVDLYVYDAGTDDGATYTSPDADSNPKQTIFRIETSPFNVNGTVTPVGKFIFTKK